MMWKGDKMGWMRGRRPFRDMVKFLSNGRNIGTLRYFGPSPQTASGSVADSLALSRSLFSKRSLVAKKLRKNRSTLLAKNATGRIDHVVESLIVEEMV